MTTGKYTLSMNVNSLDKPVLNRITNQSQSVVSIENFGVYTSDATDNGDGTWAFSFESGSVNEISDAPKYLYVNATVDQNGETVSVQSTGILVFTPEASEEKLEIPAGATGAATEASVDFGQVGPGKGIALYYESTDVITSSDEPQFSHVDLDGDDITGKLGGHDVEVVSLGNSEWQVSFKIDTKEEFHGKVSAIFEINGGNELDGVGLAFVGPQKGVEYTFKDANEAKSFIKDANNVARQILADLNALESSQLKQERILSSADRLYDSYERRIDKLKERVDAILKVRDERVANLLLAFEAELEKSELIANDIIKLKEESDFSSKAIAIENLDSEFSKAIPPVIKTNFEKVRLSEEEAVTIVKKDVSDEKAEVISKLRGGKFLHDGELNEMPKMDMEGRKSMQAGFGDPNGPVSVEP